jgi:hypothetical protein
VKERENRMSAERRSKSVSKNGSALFSNNRKRPVGKRCAVVLKAVPRPVPKLSESAGNDPLRKIPRRPLRCRQSKSDGWRMPGGRAASRPTTRYVAPFPLGVLTISLMRHRSCITEARPLRLGGMIWDRRGPQLAWAQPSSID